MSELLTASQQEFLLRLARETITAHLRGTKKPTLAGTDLVLKGKRGAFVTLHIDGDLRGCIGYPLPYKPLVETISEMALAAATQDHRFESIREDELGRLRVEISALTLPRPIKDPTEVEVGRHGIIVSMGGRQGLLLPQVPAEYGWDRETFLRHGCLKAGLPDDAWKKGASIQVFEAQVFSEAERVS
jgi:AmmeMemoRadiSam system protein A